MLYGQEPNLKIDERTHSVRLLMGKVKVMPSSHKTKKLHRSTPRTEKRGLLLLTRTVTACLERLSKSPSRISLFKDSECTISTMVCTDCVLDPWFVNRVGEVQEQIDSWKS